jgi:hypothetical protein
MDDLIEEAHTHEDDDDNGDGVGEQQLGQEPENDKQTDAQETLQAVAGVSDDGEGPATAPGTPQPASVAEHSTGVRVDWQPPQGPPALLRDPVSGVDERCGQALQRAIEAEQRGDFSDAEVHFAQAIKGGQSNLLQRVQVNGQWAVFMWRRRKSNGTPQRLDDSCDSQRGVGPHRHWRGDEALRGDDA